MAKPKTRVWNEEKTYYIFIKDKKIYTANVFALIQHDKCEKGCCIILM